MKEETIGRELSLNFKSTPLTRKLYDPALSYLILKSKAIIAFPTSWERFYHNQHTKQLQVEHNN